MKAHPILSGSWKTGQMILAGIWAAGFMAGAEAVRAAAAPATNTVVEIQIPRSTFVNDYKVGKDPFFPNSTRRNPVQPKPPVVTPPVAPPGTTVTPPTPAVVEPPKPPPPPPPLASYLTAKTIFFRGPGQRNNMVSINSGVRTYDFFPGDSLSVRIPGHPDKEAQKTVRVKVTEIKQDSVVVQISEGTQSETKEIFLKRGN